MTRPSCDDCGCRARQPATGAVMAALGPAFGQGVGLSAQFHDWISAGRLHSRGEPERGERVHRVERAAHLNRPGTTSDGPP